MAEVIRVENRTCPFCGFEYVRTVYATNKGTGSICPECRRRSDSGGRKIGKWKAPELRVCALENCKETFYANGQQKYCVTCGIGVRLKQNREAKRRFDARARMSVQNES